MNNFNKNQLYADFEYAADCETKINYIEIFKENLNGSNVSNDKNYCKDNIEMTKKSLNNLNDNNSYYKIIKSGEIQIKKT